MICSYFLEYFVIFFKFEIDKLRETDVILLFMIILSEQRATRRTFFRNR